MDWKYLYTSFEGRINRQPFWLSLLALIVLQWVLMMVIGLFVGGSMMGQIDANTDPALVAGRAMTAFIPIMIISLIFLYPTLAVYTKRWHDRDKSGWWSLILLVPFVGAIWFLVECGFLRGSDGPNNYGNDPFGP